MPPVFKSSIQNCTHFLFALSTTSLYPYGAHQLLTMGIIFSSSALNREDAMIEATRAAVAAGHPSDVEGAGAVRIVRSSL